MKVLVTGGTGFVGSWVVERLISDGHDVSIFARTPGKIPAFAHDHRLRFVAGDMQDIDAIERALDGAEACVHVALAHGDGAAGTALAETVPTIRLFEAAADAGLERIIYTSSVAVFAEPDDVFDDDSPMRPARYYGATKASAETYLMAVGWTRSLLVNAIRPGYTFGNPVVPGAPTQSMPEFPRMVGQALRGEPIEVVVDDGLQFIWAGDLASVYSAVLTSESNRQFFTALSPEFITWDHIAQLIVDTVDSRSEIRRLDRSLQTARPHYGVESIERQFGLRFDAEQHLLDHFAYLAGRGR